MPVEYKPHPIEWTAEKVSRFWDFNAIHGAGEFFSEKSSDDLVRTLLAAHQIETIVDIGCGTGPLIAAFARRGVRAIGIDSSEGVLRLARKRSTGLRPEPEFHLGSLTSIPLPDGTADAATLIEVIEHLDDDTLAAALREARRIVRSGGVLMVTTPNAEDLAASTIQCPDCGGEFHAIQHVRSWTARSLGEALLAAGFSKVRVKPRAFAEKGGWSGRLLPLAYRVLKRPPPRLLALATRAPA